MPVLRYQDDPWAGKVSIRGYALDELISALQKLVRRGQTEEAVLVARELWETSDALVGKVWERLRVISIEDVGVADPDLVLRISSLDRFQQQLPVGSRDAWLMTVHAVRLLSEAKKDRSSDDLAAWAILMMQTGRRLPVIPEYALDVHTQKGQEQGRGTLHFLESSAEVANLNPEYSDKYWKQLRAAAEEGVWND